MAIKGKYFAVKQGRRPGIYSTWAECQNQVKGFRNAIFKKFDTLQDAKTFIGTASAGVRKPTRSFGSYYAVRDSVTEHGRIFTNWNECKEYMKQKRGLSVKKFGTRGDAANFVTGFKKQDHDFELLGHKPTFTKIDTNKTRVIDKKVIIYCDGSSLNNGAKNARAGYGVYFDDPEFAQYNISERLKIGQQTNNRGELKAVSEALGAIIKLMTEKQTYANFVIRTDSEYTVKLLNDRYHYMTNQEIQTVPNSDLIWPLIQNFIRVRQFYILNKDAFSNKGEFEISWIKAHAGFHGNEMADQLAKDGAMKQM